MPVSLGATREHGFDEPLELLSDCHRRIERFLGILRTVLERAQGRTLNEEERQAVEGALVYFRTAAPRHTADEEESLFPILRASGQARVQAALKTVELLESDHAAANVSHAEVESLYHRWIDQGSLGDQPRESLSRLLNGLAEMYQRHIEVEDREIFPLAGEVLNRQQVARLGKDMAERRGLSMDKT